jgi:hypothetical protein
MCPPSTPSGNKLALLLIVGSAGLASAVPVHMAQNSHAILSDEPAVKVQYRTRQRSTFADTSPSPPSLGGAATATAGGLTPELTAASTPLPHTTDFEAVVVQSDTKIGRWGCQGCDFGSWDCECDGFHAVNDNGCGCCCSSTTGTGSCFSHSSCSSDEYCDHNHDCWDCNYVRGGSCDAYDGDCSRCASGDGDDDGEACYDLVCGSAGAISGQQVGDICQAECRGECNCDAWSGGVCQCTSSNAGRDSIGLGAVVAVAAAAALLCRLRQDRRRKAEHGGGHTTLLGAQSYHAQPHIGLPTGTAAGDALSVYAPAAVQAVAVQ